MKLNQNLNAAILAMAASAILSFVDNFVSEVAKDTGLWQFHVTRTIMALPLVFIGAKILKLKLKPKNFKLLTIRSLVVSTGLMLYFSTLGILPVSQAAAGLFSAPIWVLVFSAVLFSQRLSALQILATLGGFIGVLLVLKINPTSLTILTLVPLIAGAFYGLGVLITRHWCSSESPAALAFGIFLSMGLFSLVILVCLTIWPVHGGESEFILRGYQPVTERFYWLTAFQAGGAVIAVTLISQAYRIGDPNYVAVFEYSFLIFAAIWAFLLWGLGLGTNSIIGICLIIICGVVIALVDQKKKSRIE